MGISKRLLKIIITNNNKIKNKLKINLTNRFLKNDKKRGRDRERDIESSQMKLKVKRNKEYRQQEESNGRYF